MLKSLHLSDLQTSAYPTDLTPMQKVLASANLEEFMGRLRKYDPLDILDAVAYMVRTGCQWAMLPREYPSWRMVYHHFRSLSDRGWFQSFLKTLVEGRRAALGQHPDTSECIVDSQSVRSAIPDSSVTMPALAH